VDGNEELRQGTVSAFSGPEPTVRALGSADEETAVVAAWLAARAAEGVSPHEIGVFVRSEDQLDRVHAAAHAGGLDARVVDGSSDGTPGAIAIGTMHLAKGLEFRAVAVMACDDEVLPLQARVEGVADEGDLADVYETERHLLYVACTRARELLLVTGALPASEFLDDLRGVDRIPARGV
jgi:superfamily I DNA/RNA helicase